MAINNPYANRAWSVDGPVRNAAVITPNDETELDTVCRAVWAETSGTLHFVYFGGNEDTITIPANTWVPIVVRKVFLTGTTASGLRGAIE